MIRYIWSLAIVSIAACSLASALAADAPKSSTKSSLDDELLKGLDNDLTKDLDDLPALKRPFKPSETGSDDPAKESPTIIDGEDLGQPSEDQDPFGRIARRMRQVESRIAVDQTGAETQRRQQEIVDEMAALIEKLKKECQGGECKPGENPQESQRSKPSQASKPGGSNSGKSPARDSTTKLRQDTAAKPKPNPDAIRQNMKEAWGNLPERLREQMMQTSVDEFLPKYELMIEQYFKRLAEEESTNPIEPQRRGDAERKELEPRINANQRE